MESEFERKSISAVATFFAFIAFAVIWLIASTVVHFLFVVFGGSYEDVTKPSVFLLACAGASSGVAGTIAAAFVIDKVFKVYYKKGLFMILAIAAFLIAVASFENSYWVDTMLAIIQSAAMMFMAYLWLIKEENLF